MRELVLASGNPGKLKELGQLLGASGYHLRPQSDWQIESAEETGQTFVENALLKARHASRLCRLPAVADDSGLVVKALDGQPGIHSARYAGDRADAERNNSRLLAELAGETDRRASFYCVMVLLRQPLDPAPLIAWGSWPGSILEQARGSGGFGYDPLFLVPELGQTAAELDPVQKNLLSHRGKASRGLVALLQESTTPATP